MRHPAWSLPHWRGAAPRVLFPYLLALCAALLTGAVAAQTNPETVPLAARIQVLNEELLRAVGEPTKGLLRGTQAVPSDIPSTLEERAKALTLLFQQDGCQAASLILADESLKKLAAAYPQSAALLESHGAWQGTTRVHVEDDFEKGVSRTIRRLRVGDETFELYFSGSPPALTSGQTLEVRGVRLGDGILAAETSILSPAAAACTVVGEQKTIVLLVEFPSQPLPAHVTAAAYQTAVLSVGRSVDSYLRDASYGKAWLSGEVLGPLVLDRDYACSDSDGIVQAAIRAADSQVDFSKYTRLIVVAPKRGDCAIGTGLVGCASYTAPADGSFTASWTLLQAESLKTNDAVASVAGHEFGHNLGLGHANALDYGSETLGAFDKTGTELTYGDPFSIMGSSWSMAGEYNLGHFSAPHKAALGWLEGGSNVRVVESSGTFLLLPYGTRSTGLQALKVRRGSGNSAWLWLEYRQPLGPFETTLRALGPDVFNGALIHYERASSSQATQLLDFNPSSAPFNDAPLAAGKSWADAYSDLTIRIGRATGSGLEVTVAYGTSERCHYALEPGSIQAPAGGMAATLAVNVALGCYWTANSSAPWVAVSSGFEGAGSGKVSYVVAPNTSAIARTGAIALGGVTVAITQEGAAVRLDANSTVVPAAGGARSVVVSAHEGRLNWTATSSVSWISITSVVPHPRGGVVDYAVSPNRGVAARIGTLTVGGVPFTVIQQPPDPPAGGTIITTIAGPGETTDGFPATWTRLRAPSGIATDAAGNIYIAESGSHCVRRIARDGTITTVAGSGPPGFAGDGGPAKEARLNTPTGVAVDATGNLYIADAANYRVRKVTPGGIISTLAGNGNWQFSGDGGRATEAGLRDPYRVAVDSKGNLFLAERFGHRIRKVAPEGTISTLAGDGNAGFSGDGGPAVQARLNYPYDLAIDANGNLLIADLYNQRIRKVTPEGIISTVAGNGTAGSGGDGGRATDAQLSYAYAVACDAKGNLLIGEGNRIRKVTPDGITSTLVGGG